jgi:exonuclease SbcC
MQIKLKNLKITNFKGIEHFEASFNHITNVFGENATGKTTIMDAFLWLFFGKNSEDVSQFEVKRLDANNRFIKDQEAEVEAIIRIDQQEIAVKKVLRQKWTRRRGELDKEYTGDENVYYWNDVPLKESEFKTKIKDIIDENLFRLITNPFFFNSQKWQTRRNTLIDIAGNITNQEVLDVVVNAGNKKQYADLIAALNNKKTLDEFKAELAAKKKKIKDEQENIPSRIDEVRRGMPGSRNFDAIRDELKTLTEQLWQMQLSMNDEAAQQQEENKRRTNQLKEYNAQVQQKQQSIFNVKTKIQNVEFDAKQQAKEQGGQLQRNLLTAETKLKERRLDKTGRESLLHSLELQVQEKEKQIDELRHEYAAADAKELVFEPGAFVCPSCKQSLPENDVEAKKDELTGNFNRNKLQQLTNIKSKGETLKNEITNLNERISNGKTSIKSLDDEITELEKYIELRKEELNLPGQSVEDITKLLLSTNVEYKELKKQLADLEAVVLTEPEFEPLQTNEELKTKQASLNNLIKDAQRILMDEETITKANVRIQELQEQESTLALQLAALEGSEFAILEFTKAKVDAIERRINGKFKNVKFKMFTQQVNGGEAETCETLVNSNGSFVPFPDANNAAKINAGIDIINTLCQHYDVYAPIFIDNRESVTRLIDSESQIVNLIVSEADKKLRVA